MPCLTLMAFREPLKSMLCEETSVHTGLSWARIVFTFCRFWISHTWWVGGPKASGTSPASLSPGLSGVVRSLAPPAGPTHNDGAVCRAAVELAPGEAKLRCQGRRHCPTDRALQAEVALATRNQQLGAMPRPRLLP